MSFAELRERRRPTVPLAPMLDIMFLLLIFFVTTASMREQERFVEVQLPRAEMSDPPAVQGTKVVINVLADGTISVYNQTHDPKTLRRVLEQLHSDDDSGLRIGQVVLRADGRAPYQSIVTVRDVVNMVGIERLVEVTVKPASAVVEP